MEPMILPEVKVSSRDNKEFNFLDISFLVRPCSFISIT